MPPDGFSGGRDRHVRGVTAPFFQNSSSTVFVNFPSSISSPITPDSTPPTSHYIKSSGTNSSLSSGQEVNPDLFKNHKSVCSIPTLTPCASSESLLFDLNHSNSNILTPVFPEGLKDVEGIHDVSATLPAGLQGVLIDKNSGTRTVYILGLDAPSVSQECLKTLLVELLDLADEKLEADEIVFVLEKHRFGLRELLQGLLYVGGQVIRHREDVVAEDSFVLIGVEL